MKQLLPFIALFLSTLSQAQTTISSDQFLKLLTTTYDTTGNDSDIDFATWSTANQDSSFFKSDTIRFYRNPDFRFCADSISPCKTVDWNFYVDPFTQTESITRRSGFQYGSGSGGILSTVTENEQVMELKIREKDGTLFVSTKTQSKDWQDYQVIEIQSSVSRYDPAMKVTELTLKKK